MSRRLFGGLHVAPAPKTRTTVRSTRTGKGSRQVAGTSPESASGDDTTPAWHVRGSAATPLLPEALEQLTTRWGMTHGELGTLLGISPEAVALAIATGSEPSQATFEGAVLLGVLVFVLSERAAGSSDEAVAAWLNEPCGAAAQRRAGSVAQARSVQEIGLCLDCTAAGRV